MTWGLSPNGSILTPARQQIQLLHKNWMSSIPRHQKTRPYTCSKPLVGAVRWSVVPGKLVIGPTRPTRIPLPCMAAPFSSTTFASYSISGNMSTNPQPPDHLDEKERHIWEKLYSELNPSSLEVRDISGGCGSMYEVAIASSKFKGMPIVQQHRLVNQILKDEIAGWHGIRLETKPE